MNDKPTPGKPPIVIKKYANRRLYNTETSSYVTLDHLARMVKEGSVFVVKDAKTGEDITRSVLTQIIVEEESKGESLLPIGFLRQLIGFYGDSLQSLVPRYLEYSMQSFSKNQERMRDYIRNAMSGLFPIAPFEEMGRQNMALFESAMRMFQPLYGKGDTKQGGPVDPNAPAPTETPGATYEREIAELRERLAQMQKSLDRMAERGRK